MHVTYTWQIFECPRSHRLQWLLGLRRYFESIPLLIDACYKSFEDPKNGVKLAAMKKHGDPQVWILILWRKKRAQDSGQGRIWIIN
jgi:hypothetical protein